MEFACLETYSSVYVQSDSTYNSDVSSFTHIFYCHKPAFDEDDSSLRLSSPTFSCILCAIVTIGDISDGGRVIYFINSCIPSYNFI